MDGVEDVDELDESIEVVLPSGLIIYSRAPTRDEVRALFSPESLAWTDTHTRDDAENMPAEVVADIWRFTDKAIIAFWTDPKTVQGRGSDDLMGTADIDYADKQAYFDWMYSFVPVSVSSSGIEA